jgi:hypothetical protein
LLGIPALVALVLLAGNIEGKKAAGDLKNYVGLDCLECSHYQGGTENVLGLPAMKAKDGLFVLHQDGLTHFASAGLRVSRRPAKVTAKPGSAKR